MLFIHNWSINEIEIEIVLIMLNLWLRGETCSNIFQWVDGGGRYAIRHNVNITAGSTRSLWFILGVHALYQNKFRFNKIAILPYLFTILILYYSGIQTYLNFICYLITKNHLWLSNKIIFGDQILAVVFFCGAVKFSDGTFIVFLWTKIIFACDRYLNTSR